MRSQDGEAEAYSKPRLADIRPAIRMLADLILPARAFDDGSPVQSPGLSTRGWSRIRFIDSPVCDGCGAPFEHDLGRSVRCAACLARPRVISRARAACLYDEVSRDPILKLKHADRLDLAPLFARWLSRAARDLIDEADAIAPVPLHRGRLLRRRYNQAAEIARPGPKSFPQLSFGENIETGCGFAQEHYLKGRQKVKSSLKRPFEPLRSLRYHRHLTEFAGKQGDDPARLAEVGHPDHDRRSFLGGHENRS